MYLNGCLIFLVKPNYSIKESASVGGVEAALRAFPDLIRFFKSALGLFIVPESDGVLMISRLA